MTEGGGEGGEDSLSEMRNFSALLSFLSMKPFSSGGCTFGILPSGLRWLASSTQAFALCLLLSSEEMLRGLAPRLWVEPESDRWQGSSKAG